MKPKYIALVLSLVASSSYAQITFTVEPAGVESTTVPGVTTETFDTQPLGAFSGSTAVGSFTSGGNISAASIYGGAGNSDFYQVVGLGSSTLTFASSQDYVGMWWSAGDAGNELKFYDGAILVGDYVVSTYAAGLPPSYYGNPTSGPNFGGDSGEPFAYINFTAQPGTTITSVEFDENLPGAGFELDNISILNSYITPPGSPVPDETSTTGLLIGALFSLIFIGAHKKMGRLVCV
jgi:hypothetical protein